MQILKRVALLAAAISLSAGLAGAGVRVELSKVPAPAVKTIKDRFKKAEIRYIDKETDGHFEFVLKEGDRQFDAGVTAGGKFLGTKEEVALDKVPEAVKQGAEKKYPGGKIVEAEKVTRGDGANEKISYEVLVMVGVESHTIELDAKGKLVEKD